MGEMLQGGVASGAASSWTGDIRLLRTVHTRCDLNSQLCRQTIIYQCYQGGGFCRNRCWKRSAPACSSREVLLLLRQTGFAGGRNLWRHRRPIFGGQPLVIVVASNVALGRRARGIGTSPARDASLIRLTFYKKAMTR